MSRDQWSGVVFALLVVVPAALIPMMGHSEKLLDLRYSLWAIVPVIGGFISGWILRRRLSLALFAAVAGYTGFWSAATWGAGSRATSVYEALAATGVGILPVFLFYALYKRFSKPRNAATSDLPNRGMPFGQIIGHFWKQILFFGGAFLVMTVMTVMDLNALESGEVETVRLWAPIVSFYERFGYWPAVLLPPVLGLICGSILCWSLMKRGTIHPPQRNAGEQDADGNPH